jgi:hypothetical protein
LCLTDLARAGWDIHEIALFAGHRCIQIGSGPSTLRSMTGRLLSVKRSSRLSTSFAPSSAGIGGLFTRLNWAISTGY